MDKQYTYDKIVGKVEKANKVQQTPTWTRYEVVINNEKFSAFDSEFLAMIGVEATYDFKIDEFNRRTLLNLPKTPKKVDSSDYRIMDSLKRIEEKIDRLGELLAPEPTPGDLDEQKYPEDNEDPNLPF